MREAWILVVHFMVTMAKLPEPGGAKRVVCESLLLRQQLLVLNRSRRRAPNLTTFDRVLMGLCTMFVTRRRLWRVAITLKPKTLLGFHDALVARKYRRLFSNSNRRKPGPKGPSVALVRAIVEMKRRNPRFGCPRIAQQLANAFGIEVDKDVVRCVLAKHYRGGSGGDGPS